MFHSQPQESIPNVCHVLSIMAIIMPYCSYYNIPYHHTLIDGDILSGI